MIKYKTRLIEDRANSGLSNNYLVKNAPMQVPPPVEPEEPIIGYDCSGADDRIEFNQWPDNDDMPDNSGENDLIYKVTVNGVAYGEHDFINNPEPTFGDVSLIFTRIDETGGCVIKLKGGIPNVKHHIKLDSVSSIVPGYTWHGNNIHRYNNFLEDNGNTSITYYADNRSIEFCLMKRGECYLAPNEIEYKIPDDSSTSSIYDVTINGMTYNAIDLRPKYFDGDGPKHIKIGGWRLGYDDSWWGGTFNIASHSSGVSVHFKLTPVNVETPLFDSFDYARTIVHDKSSGVVEFCLMGQTDAACEGATDLAEFQMIELYDNDWKNGLLEYALEVDGKIYGDDEGVGNLLNGDVELNDGRYTRIYFDRNSDAVVTINSYSNDNKLMKIRLLPPSNITQNIISAAFTQSNPTIKLDENTGIITFCLLAVVAS